MEHMHKTSMYAGVFLRRAQYLAMILLCLSCTPVVSVRQGDRALIVTNKSGSFSCLRSSCCWPYKHHRDVEIAAAMVCVDEKTNAKQISEGGLPISEVDLNLRVIYDESKLLGAK